MKRKIILTIIFATIITMGLSLETVQAAAGTTRISPSNASIWKADNRDINKVGWSGRYRVGVLRINSNMVYCLWEGKGYSNGWTYHSQDALAHFTSRLGGNQKRAQELLTKIALYHKYLVQRGDLTIEQIHYFGQVLIWNEMIDYGIQMGRAVYYWIEAWNNPSIFPCKQIGDACMGPNTEFEHSINNGAKAYYNANKSKYVGTGTVWWDYNNGHQPVIEFDTKLAIPDDYNITSNCEDCNSKGTNGSLNLKDTTNFTSIINSRSEVSSKLGYNAKQYYEKGANSGVYCREEYKVIFPNANNQITVASGRYFTINKQGGSMYSNGVPNLKTIKVEKIRECQAKLSSSELQPTECGPVKSTAEQQSMLKSKLNNFTSAAKKASDGIAAGKSGTVKLIYNETYDGRYNPTEETLEENKERTVTTESSSSANTPYTANICHWEYYTSENGTTTRFKVCLDQTFTSYYKYKYTSAQYYELSENVYRYVNKQTGVASLKKPTGESFTKYNRYTDIGTANLPISYNNTGNDKGIAGTVQFNYKLPNNDPYSLMYKAKTGNCYEKIANQDYYVCNLKICPPDEFLCSNGECSTNGVCETPMPSCQLLEGIYYGPNGEVLKDEAEFNQKCPSTSDKTGGKICRIEGSKYYGQDGQEVTKDEYYAQCPQKQCTIINGKYYGKTGQIVSQAQYNKECPNDCPFECKYGCCPSWYEGSGMMCKDMNGECPIGGNKIIYRPIDLLNPFPGQTNYGRATGSNWCSWNTIKGGVTCKNTNGVVNKQIFNNRGSEYDKVYGKKPLYTFELDANTIQKVRDYNKKQRRNGNDYDDFTLDCTNPNGCYSTFFRDAGIIKMNTDKSACAQISSIPTCAGDEERGGH